MFYICIQEEFPLLPSKFDIAKIYEIKLLKMLQFLQLVELMSNLKNSVQNIRLKKAWFATTLIRKTIILTFLTTKNTIKN